MLQAINNLLAKFDLKPEFKLSLKTLAVAIFLGILIAEMMLSNPEKFISFIKYLFQDIVEKALGRNFLQMFWLIFTNNISTSLTIIAAALIYRYLPLFFLFINGVVLGMIVYGAARLTNNWVLITYILPHGVFELPAIILATSIGLSLGRKSEKYGFKGKLKALIYSKKAIFTVVILLLVAAIIEAGLIISPG